MDFIEYFEKTAVYICRTSRNRGISVFSDWKLCSTEISESDLLLSPKNLKKLNNRYKVQKKTFFTFYKLAKYLVEYFSRRCFYDKINWYRIY